MNAFAPAPLRPVFTRGLAFIAFGGLLVFDLVSKGATRIYTWPWTLYSDLLLLLPLAVLGTKFIRERGERRTGGIAFLALGAALALSALCSRHPLFSWESNLVLWSGLAWSWLVAEFVATAKTSTTFIWFLRAGGTFFALPLALGLIWWTQDLIELSAAPAGWSGVLAQLPFLRNPYPLGHWNYTGGFALLALPWLGLLAWIEGRAWRAGWSLSVVIGVGAFLSAASRGAVLGALVAMAASAAVILVTRRVTRRHLAITLLLGLVVVAGLFATNPRLRTLALHPTSALTPDDGDVQRLGMLQGGWLLVRQSPWIGHGAGMTPFVYPDVRARLIGGVETSYQLHNGWLQVWVDAGLLGMVTSLGCSIALLLATLRWMRAMPDQHRLFGLASACTLIGYSALGFTDYQLNAPIIVAALGLHAGFVLAAPTTQSRSGGNRRFLGGLLIAFTFATLCLLFPRWRSRSEFWSAWHFPEAEMIKRLQSAVELAPNDFNFRNQLGLQLAVIAEKTDNANLRRAAREQLIQSNAIDRSQEPVHAALGWVWLYDDPKQSQREFSAALALLPDRETLHLGLALSELSLGEQAGAVDALAWECIINPLFLASPLWNQPPLAPVREIVDRRIAQLYPAILSAPGLPVWRQPRIIYGQAFARWWRGGALPSDQELIGATKQQRRFFDQLRAAPLVAPLWNAPLDRLAMALADPTHAETILQKPPTALPPPAIDGALARLSSTPRAADLSTLLRQPSPAGQGIMRRWIERAHFQIMQRNLDGPGYADLAPHLDDAFSMTFAGELFSERGLLPGPVIESVKRESVRIPVAQP